MPSFVESKNQQERGTLIGALIVHCVALLTTLLLAGCNPIPAKYACELPDFSKTEALEVDESYPTWGYFSVRCTKTAPMQFTVKGRSASLSVLVEGDWLRLSAKDFEDNALQLQGSSLNGSNARVDEQANNVLDVEVIPADGGQPERFTLPFELQKCTCVSYDAV